MARNAADFADIVSVMRRGPVGKVPLYEHFVDDEIIEQVLGVSFSAICPELGSALATLSETTVSDSLLPAFRKIWAKRLEFYRDLGYDFLPVEFPPLFAKSGRLHTDDTAVYSRGKRDWVDEHHGIIKSLRDLENPALWPDDDDAFDYRLFDTIAELVPDGMGIVGGFAGGPFEHSLYLLGFEPLFIALSENPGIVERLYAKLDGLFCEITRRLVVRKKLGVFRIGDDLGFKTGPMMSPGHMRRYVFPTYRRIIAIAHGAGMPFILHSCGNLAVVMEDLIEGCRIDAKHSFEDVIEPVTEAKRRWGSRIALLGGIDVDLLCRSTPAYIKEHTKRVMAECARGGGYAVGSGNTIANYVPVGNYLAMVEAAREFNGSN